MFDHWYRRLYEGANYRLRTFAGGRWASHCRPTSIGFMLTDLCNARCVHCDIWKNRGKDDSPSVENYQQVFSDLRDWLGPVHLFFSGGEALLKPFSTDLVAHASSIGLFVEFLTHGYWDDQSRIEKLARAKPSRVTVSLDGIGEAHTRVRGRPKFFEKTLASLRTLQRIRQENGSRYAIRLKTVIMSQNLNEVCEVAHFARQEEMEVFYQAVEQNYNTPEDPRWFEHSENWPRDTGKAIAVVQHLLQLKREGLPIANSFHQLEVMIPYFRDPDSSRISIQSHSAHERKSLCAALTNIQVQANGDVLACYGMKPVGNIKSTPIRQIWENRPPWWEQGCCLVRRCSSAEKQLHSLPVLS